MTRFKKQPPYSRLLTENLKNNSRRWWGMSPDGKHPALFLLCGSNAWTVAKQWKDRRLLTLLPPGEDPALFNWRILSDAEPLLLWRCGDIEQTAIINLLQAVMSDGIARVFDVLDQVRYVREYVNAA